MNELLKIILVFSVLLFSCEEKKKTVKLETATELKVQPVLDNLMLTNGEWPPYCGAQLPGGGVSAEISSAALAKVGITTSYEYYNWSRALELASSGKFAGSTGWYKSPEREKNFYFSEPIHRIDTVIFHLKSLDFNWAKVKDLKNFTIAGTRAYEYGAAFNEAEKSGLLKVRR
ncbi:MAG: transporter substrate-binding domain-containing protein, partial [Lentisphaeraceae bacterium]|nr:transporter substrate-binding domain-containing protein [Lentisphaeraceae bacterium]